MTSLYLFNYELAGEDDINGEWTETIEKQKIEITDLENLTINESLKGYYVMVEVYDFNNDVFYSDIKYIK